MGKISNISPYIYPGVFVDYIDVMIRVCKLYPEVTPEMLMQQRRLRHIVEPRQISMYLLKKELKYTLQAIQKIFNFKTHAAVMYSVRTIENLMQTNQEFQNKVKSLICK